jgi:hypothetical protein
MVSRRVLPENRVSYMNRVMRVERHMDFVNPAAQPHYHLCQPGHIAVRAGDRERSGGIAEIYLRVYNQQRCSHC